MDGLRKVSDGLGKVLDGLGKESVGFRKVSDALVKVSDGFGKVSDGLRKESDGLGKVPDGLSNVSSMFVAYCLANRWVNLIEPSPSHSVHNFKQWESELTCIPATLPPVFSVV